MTTVHTSVNSLQNSRKLPNENTSSPEFKDKVLYKCLETDDKPLTKKDEEKLIESFIGKWSEEFAKLPELAEQINPQRTGIEADDPDKIETKRRNDIWRLSLTKRILCAERRGLRGIENINKKVCSKIKSLWRTKRKKKAKQSNGTTPVTSPDSS